jgi:heme/copper-type cytochrome/quinol oxidase subunit 2
MAKKEGDFSEVSYVFGIMSVVLAFFTPLAGFIFGIIGIVQSKKQKTPLSEKGKKLSIIGVIISIVLFITLIAIAYFKIGINPLI